MPKILFTTSWDDGHPLDIRVADLMAKYGIAGTFYVPLENREGLPVLEPKDISELDSAFEIGSHTMTHCYLTRVEHEQARQEIEQGKRALEDILGKQVRGFCYPGGKYNSRIRRCVVDAGFDYARTVENFQVGFANDRYAIPTTLQLYPHNSMAYCSNFIKKGHWVKRAPMFWRSSIQSDLLLRLCQHVDFVCSNYDEAVLHFWGHSWEVDNIAGWGWLEDFFRFVSKREDLIMVRNCEIVR